MTPFPVRLALLVSVLTVTAAHAAPLRSPWDNAHVRLTDAAYTCPAPITVPADLTMDGFYRLDDPAHSIVDPVRMAAYTAASAPVKDMGRAIVASADAFRQTGSKAAGTCTVKLIESLAANNSMDGRMSSNQSRYVQGWVAGAVAIAFLKVRGYGFSTHQQDAAIGRWLVAIGEQTKSFYDKPSKGDGNRNNHYYWAGIELTAIGVVAENKADFDWGINTYRDGVNRIQPNGALPLEMARGERALHYHLYALAPLVLLAEFGEANGMDLYALNHGAIHKLERISIHGLSDPSLFEKATGIKQEVPQHPNGDDIGWAPPYQRRFPDPEMKHWIDQASTLSVFYLGGLPPR